MSGGASQALREQVRNAASDRCGYCLCRQEYVPGVLEIDHIVPKAAGGTDEEENLWLACRMCNHAKGVQHTGSTLRAAIACGSSTPGGNLGRATSGGATMG